MPPPCSRQHHRLCIRLRRSNRSVVGAPRPQVLPSLQRHGAHRAVMDCEPGVDGSCGGHDLWAGQVVCAAKAECCEAGVLGAVPPAVLFTVMINVFFVCE